MDLLFVYIQHPEIQDASDTSLYHILPEKVYPCVTFCYIFLKLSVPLEKPESVCFYTAEKSAKKAKKIS